MFFYAFYNSFVSNVFIDYVVICLMSEIDNVEMKMLLSMENIYDVIDFINVCGVLGIDGFDVCFYR